MIKETTEIATSVLLLDLYLKFDANGQLAPNLYDNTDDFNIAILFFQQIDSIITTGSTHEVYVSRIYA